MKRIIIAATTALALGACQAPMVTWEKQGSNQTEFNMDVGQCNNQAYALYNAPPFQRAMVFQSCMQGKGYQKVASQ